MRYGGRENNHGIDRGERKAECTGDEADIAEHAITLR